MRLLICSLCLLAVSCTPTRAQEIPAGEAFVGYSFASIDTNGLSNRQSANGFEAAISANANRYFAGEFDLSGAYKNILGVSISDYLYAGGLRVNFRPVFAHVLFGGDDLRGSYSGTSASQQSFATIFGGGIQQKITDRFSIRASADYVTTHHNILGGPRVDQNNFRVAAGIVFTFGRTHYGGETARSRMPDQPQAGEQSALLGITGVPASTGVRVTVVRPGSPASRAAIEVNDIIFAINGNDVHSIRDIELEIGKAAASPIRINYLSKGIASVQSSVSIAPPNN